MVIENVLYLYLIYNVIAIYFFLALAAKLPILNKIVPSSFVALYYTKLL